MRHGYLIFDYFNWLLEGMLCKAFEVLCKAGLLNVYILSLQYQLQMCEALNEGVLKAWWLYQIEM